MSSIVFRVKRALEKDILSQNSSDGTVYYCLDTGCFYLNGRKISNKSLLNEDVFPPPYLVSFYPYPNSTISHLSKEKGEMDMYPRTIVNYENTIHNSSEEKEMVNNYTSSDGSYILNGVSMNYKEEKKSFFRRLFCK